MSNEIFGYVFKNQNLLKEALSHPSLGHNPNNKQNYERFEFLGDAVLGLIIIEYLIIRFPEEDEGKLAKRKANLVSGDILSKIGNDLNIGKRLYMSDSEDRHGGRNNPHNIENALEAIIAAIYLDSDLITTKKIILEFWHDYIENMKEIPLDYKSELQEELQRREIKLPEYELISQTGPAHMLTFTVGLSIEGFKKVLGTGKSKKEAEKKAAAEFLKQLNS